tara:strand:- start:4836 stop:6101 length:1266 start_codon:yes stop_codon:yes gene_type:complete
MPNKILIKKVVHFSNHNTTIESSGRLISIHKKENNIKTQIMLPFCFPRDYHLNITILKRLLRSDAKEVIYDRVTGKLIIIRDSCVYLIQELTYRLLGKIEGDSPLFNSHCIHNGTIYFGQYDQNKTRKSSKIYKIDNKNNISIAYTFLPGVIRHVHSITNDLYIENRIWVTTGDNDGECLLLYTDDNFKNITNIGDKSQDFRIVNIGFSKDYLFYGTDNLIKENYIYRQNRSDGKREKVLSVKQTAWFLKQDKKGNAILGTTVENGKGCQVNYSSIYFSRDFGINWLELLRIPKDIYPMPLFKWGSVSFSNGAESLDDLFINVESLINLTGKSFNLGYLTNFSEKDLRRIEVKKKDYFENNSHLMLVIYRLFSLYENTQDLRFLNLLLKLIDWMPIYSISQKKELRIKALNIYEGINNSSN